MYDNEDDGRVVKEGAKVVWWSVEEHCRQLLRLL